MLPAYPAFSLLFCPPSPKGKDRPPTPFPAGRGRSKVYFAGGFAPGTPALDRSRHLQLLLCGHLAQGSQWFAVTPTEALSYEQCRQPRRGGTRGRWNYPSHATAAFEMVLSPGAGRTSAAVAPSIKIREKFWGVWGTLSRVPQRFSLPPSRVSIF